MSDMVRIIIIFLVLAGCTTGPRYNHNKVVVENHSSTYPVENYYEKKENQTQLNFILTHENENKYDVVADKISSWTVGDPNATLQVGKENYRYKHKINMTLYCLKNSSLPEPMRRQAVKWKLDENLHGELNTDLSGRLNIIAENYKETQFSQITMKTSKNSYVFSLKGNLFFELKPEDCE